MSRTEVDVHASSDHLRGPLSRFINLLSRLGNRWIVPFENATARFARRKHVVILCLAAATMFARLVLLPAVHAPVPAIHDEFSYLLAADTFAHGRLTNPPHPMWIYFDTFHVLQQPTYASKYPPAAGAAMALGQIFGHPWLGVLLTLVAMVMAMTWMLQGWFPPPWALLGGVLVMLHLGLLNHWMENFYNTSIGTLGAALVLGAVPRIVHFGDLRASILMGIGAMILAASRPVEGLLFCIPVGIFLVIEYVRRPKPRLAAAMPRLLLAFTIVAGIGLSFLAYYNWRVTGNALLFPYALYHQRYFNYPALVWQAVRPPLHYANPQFESFFNTWHRSNYPLTWAGWRHRSEQVFWVWWHVYLGRILTLPFLAAYRVVRDRRMRLPVLQFAFCFLGFLAVVWFQPNYAAPLAATVYVLLLQAMRHLRRVRLLGQPIGIFLTRLVVLLAVNWVVAQATHTFLNPARHWSIERAQISARLRTEPGKHLIIVRYKPTHNPHHEWVYNAADIDNAKIVWAREIPGKEIQPLLDYFKERQAWLLDADAFHPQLRSFGDGFVQGIGNPPP